MGSALILSYDIKTNRNRAGQLVYSTSQLRFAREQYELQSNSMSLLSLESEFGCSVG